jgi:hypothetical protein
MTQVEGKIDDGQEMTSQLQSVPYFLDFQSL